MLTLIPDQLQSPKSLTQVLDHCSPLTFNHIWITVELCLFRSWELKTILLSFYNNICFPAQGGSKNTRNKTSAVLELWWRTWHLTSLLFSTSDWRTCLTTSSCWIFSLSASLVHSRREFFFCTASSSLYKRSDTLLATCERSKRQRVVVFIHHQNTVSARRQTKERQLRSQRIGIKEVCLFVAQFPPAACGLRCLCYRCHTFPVFVVMWLSFTKNIFPAASVAFPPHTPFPAGFKTELESTFRSFGRSHSLTSPCVPATAPRPLLWGPSAMS